MAAANEQASSGVSSVIVLVLLFAAADVVLLVLLLFWQARFQRRMPEMVRQQLEKWKETELSELRRQLTQSSEAAAEVKASEVAEARWSAWREDELEKVRRENEIQELQSAAQREKEAAPELKAEQGSPAVVPKSDPRLDLSSPAPPRSADAPVTRASYEWLDGCDGDAGD